MASKLMIGKMLMQKKNQENFKEKKKLSFWFCVRIIESFNDGGCCGAFSISEKSLNIQSSYFIGMCDIEGKGHTRSGVKTKHLKVVTVYYYK